MEHVVCEIALVALGFPICIAVAHRFQLKPKIAVTWQGNLVGKLANARESGFSHHLYRRESLEFLQIQFSVLTIS